MDNLLPLVGSRPIDSALQTTLTATHIAAGSVCLASGVLAASVKALGLRHRAHVVAGRAFVWGMLGVCATAIALALIGERVLVLLLLVAVLSGYLAFAGWREAVRLRRPCAWLDRAAAVLMIAAAAIMLIWGGWALLGGATGGIVLLLFGSIGGMVAVIDLHRLRHPAQRAARTAHHMACMLGATTAVVTAALVVNVRFEPAWAVWIAPTLLSTPIIFLWSKRVGS